MDKRQFLLATALSLPAMRASASGRKTATLASGPAVLTVTGLIGRTNRGPLDKVLDQLMFKHGLQFERAFSFNLSALAELPQVNIRPTLEYDAKPHQLRGPLMIDVLKTAGVSTVGPTTVTIPRQSRGPSIVSRSKRLFRDANAALVLGASFRWQTLTQGSAAPTSRPLFPVLGCSDESLLHPAPPSTQSTPSPRSAGLRSCASSPHIPGQDGLRSFP